MNLGTDLINTLFCLGWDEKFKPPQYLYPTQEMFCGDDGDLEAPENILKNLLPNKVSIQGKRQWVLYVCANVFGS